MSEASLSRDEVLEIVREEMAAQRKYEQQKTALETAEVIRRMRRTAPIVFGVSA